MATLVWLWFSTTGVHPATQEEYTHSQQNRTSLLWASDTCMPWILHLKKKKSICIFLYQSLCFVSICCLSFHVFGVLTALIHVAESRMPVVWCHRLVHIESHEVVLDLLFAYSGRICSPKPCLEIQRYERHGKPNCQWQLRQRTCWILWLSPSLLKSHFWA